eukprot:TRINITY_DN21856_c0_g1_i1.p1 TRINITY_DN21856_c0_g1~~TRINITY_DN21856_c0_g1_i1.p1  ORF type:complete len:546 (+),score=111.11 TRINITY_DN21856_c0_g1_i1:94-1731(+)
MGGCLGGRQRPQTPPPLLGTPTRESLPPQAGGPASGDPVTRRRSAAARRTQSAGRPAAGGSSPGPGSDSAEMAAPNMPLFDPKHNPKDMELLKQGMAERALGDGQTFAFPADEQFWTNFKTQAQLAEDAQQTPQCMVTASHDPDSVLKVNQNWVQGYVCGWEKANPHTVEIRGPDGVKQFYASHEFWNSVVQNLPAAPAGGRGENEVTVEAEGLGAITTTKGAWQDACQSWEREHKCTDAHIAARRAELAQEAEACEQRRGAPPPPPAPPPAAAGAPRCPYCAELQAPPRCSAHRCADPLPRQHSAARRGGAKRTLSDIERSARRRRSSGGGAHRAPSRPVSALSRRSGSTAEPGAQTGKRHTAPAVLQAAPPAAGPRGSPEAPPRSPPPEPRPASPAPSCGGHCALCGRPCPAAGFDATPCPAAGWADGWWPQVSCVLRVPNGWHAGLSPARQQQQGDEWWSEPAVDRRLGLPRPAAGGAGCLSVSPSPSCGARAASLPATSPSPRYRPASEPTGRTWMAPCPAPWPSGAPAGHAWVPVHQVAV